MKTTIFYSWQSDTPNKTNRGLIEDAIKSAIANISPNDFAIKLSLDHDTKDVPGSPAIADSILKKIGICGIFICDVTIVTSPNEKRPSPNPNVLIELGYAVGKIGWDRVICIMNDSFGEPSVLPFNLKHRRWPIRYSLSLESSLDTNKAEKRNLSRSIEHAIRDILSTGLLTSSINPKDRRVAISLAEALVHFRSDLQAFFQEQDCAEFISVFSQDHLDIPNTLHPDPDLVEPLLRVFSNANFRAISNTTVAGQRLTWAQSFIYSFREIANRCNVILDRFADRDETLISIVDEIEKRTTTLAFMMQVSITEKIFIDLRHYEIGIPNNHIDQFRYFLLSVLKAYRVIREFGGE